LSDTIKVQDIEAVKGTKVHGYLKIMDRPSGKHEIPITLINGIGDGSLISEVKSPIDGVVHTMYPARLVFPEDNLYTLLKVDEATGW